MGTRVGGLPGIERLDLANRLALRTLHRGLGARFWAGLEHLLLGTLALKADAPGGLAGATATIALLHETGGGCALDKLTSGGAIDLGGDADRAGVTSEEGVEAVVEIVGHGMLLFEPQWLVAST